MLHNKQVHDPSCYRPQPGGAGFPKKVPQNDTSKWHQNGWCRRMQTMHDKAIAVTRPLQTSLPSDSRCLNPPETFWNLKTDCCGLIAATSGCFSTTPTSPLHRRGSLGDTCDMRLANIRKSDLIPWNLCHFSVLSAFQLPTFKALSGTFSRSASRLTHDFSQPQVLGLSQGWAQVYRRSCLHSPGPVEGSSLIS